MSATHAMVGVSTTTATAWLTTLLTGWHGMDSDHASAAAGLTVLVIGGILGIIGNKWPDIFGGKENA